MSQADVVALLTMEMKQQLTGCDGASCLSEIAGALNADEVLYGGVGRLGPNEQVLTLTRLDAHKQSAIASGAERLGVGAHKPREARFVQARTHERDRGEDPVAR